MSLSDPIADLLTRIRNAGRAGHGNCEILFSKMNQSILNLLKEEGYISGFEQKKDEHHAYDKFIVNLKYDTRTKKHIIKGLKRISKPGRRYYIKNESIRPVRNNIGTWIISTSKGVMTGKQAKKQKVGGEVICMVY